MDGMDYCEECEKEYKETIKNLKIEIKKLKEELNEYKEMWLRSYGC